MFDTLINIGCQPVKNDDGTLEVKYQGEHFFMEFGGRYSRVWEAEWAERFFGYFKYSGYICIKDSLLVYQLLYESVIARIRKQNFLIQ